MTANAQTPAPAGRAKPPATKDTQFFWDGARQHTLLIQRCLSCRVLRHPPTAACRACGSLESDAQQAAGSGTVFSYTVVHAPLVPPFDGPYVVGLIELDEGTRLVAGVHAPLDAVTIGMKVRVDWVDDPDVTVPVFVPAESL